MLSKFLLFSFCIFSVFAKAQTMDGLLKNGRSVVYYHQKGQWVRALEAEENEFAQICYAKVLNSFNSVQIENMNRTGRYSIAAEDIYRNKTEDVSKLPIYLPATLVYTSTAGTQKVFIQIYINPPNSTIHSNKGFKISETNMEKELWQTSDYQTTTSNGDKYSGPAQFLILGNFTVENSTNMLKVKATKSGNSFLQTQNIIIGIFAPEKQAQEILSTMQYDRLLNSLNFDDNWPE